METHTVPSPLVRPDAFRRAFREWASGVAVITVSHDGVLRGMTASSLTSVSLVPPLVSVCCDLEAKTLGGIRATQRFGVTILSSAQADLSSRFATKGLGDVRFDGQRFVLGMNGCPLLEGGIAHLECNVFASHPAGDHDIVIGAVTRTVRFDGEPLLHYDGEYRTLNR